MFQAGFIYFLSGLYILSLRIFSSRFVSRAYDFLGIEFHHGFTLRKSDFRVILLMIVLGTVAAPFIFLEGLSRIEASNASIITISELVFTFIIARVFLKERYSLREVIGMVLLATSVLLPALRIAGLINFSLKGYLLILLACFFWGIDNILSKYIVMRRDPLEASGITSLIGGICLLFLSMIMGYFEFNAFHLVILIFLGIASLGNSLIFFFVSLKHINSALANAIFMLNSVFGMYASSLIIGEKLDVYHYIAALLIILGLIVVHGIPKEFWKNRIMVDKIQ